MTTGKMRRIYRFAPDALPEAPTGTCVKIMTWCLAHPGYSVRFYDELMKDTRLEGYWQLGGALDSIHRTAQGHYTGVLLLWSWTTSGMAIPPTLPRFRKSDIDQFMDHWPNQDHFAQTLAITDACCGPNRAAWVIALKAAVHAGHEATTNFRIATLALLHARSLESEEVKE